MDITYFPDTSAASLIACEQGRKEIHESDTWKTKQRHSLNGIINLADNIELTENW